MNDSSMPEAIDLARFAVLVVEDEPLLRFDAVDLIEEAGFNVYSAANADQAILLLERHPDIRVLFTDIDMPGSMDGLKLAHAVRKRWPPVTIIVTSGHMDVKAEQMPENGLFFSKPYPPTKVVTALNRIAASI